MEEQFKARLPRQGVPHSHFDKFAVEHRHMWLISGVCLKVPFQIICEPDQHGVLMPTSVFISIEAKREEPPYAGGNKIDPTLTWRMKRDAEILAEIAKALAKNENGTDFIRNYFELLDYFKEINVISPSTYEGLGYSNPPSVPDHAGGLEYHLTSNTTNYGHK
jgi:hypothetical protein